MCGSHYGMQYSSDLKCSENIKDKFKDFIDSRLALQINGTSYNTQSQAPNRKHKQLTAVAYARDKVIFCCIKTYHA